MRRIVVLFSIVLSTGCGGGSEGSRIEATSAPAAAAREDHLQVREGVYRGTLDEQRVFKGIRYAEPPIGAARFAAPRPAQSFAGVEDATDFAPPCPHLRDGTVIGAEDCLRLNLWLNRYDGDRPADPIIVFLGPAPDHPAVGAPETLDGGDLASFTETVVITVERRRGVLGYLAIDAAIENTTQPTGGNLGILDTIAALRWIRDSSAAFNGDPDRILIAGSSAGARELCHLLAAPEAAGLFHAVAIQSGACGSRLIQHDQVAEPTEFPPANVLQAPLLAAAGCGGAPSDVIQCLRTLTLPDLLVAAAGVGDPDRFAEAFGPTIDGDVVQTNPHEALRTELTGTVPVIVGATENEVNNLLTTVDVPDDQRYRELLNERFPVPVAGELYNLFPTGAYPSAKRAYLDLMTHVHFTCEAQELARSAAGNAPAYLYGLARGFDTGVFAGFDAAHGSDLPYLLGYDRFGVVPDDPAITIAWAIRSALSSLAEAPALQPVVWFDWITSANWPPYDPSDPALLRLDDPASFPPADPTGRCAAIRELVLL